MRRRLPGRHNAEKVKKRCTVDSKIRIKPEMGVKVKLSGTVRRQVEKKSPEKKELRKSRTGISWLDGSPEEIKKNCKKRKDENTGGNRVS